MLVVLVLIVHSIACDSCHLVLVQYFILRYLYEVYANTIFCKCATDQLICPQFQCVSSMFMSNLRHCVEVTVKISK